MTASGRQGGEEKAIVRSFPHAGIGKRPIFNPTASRQFRDLGPVMTPTGQRDYSGARLTRHALERFVERFGGEPGEAEAALRSALARTRRLGRNPENGAVAVLAVHRDRVLVAIMRDSSCLTVLTWPLFEPRLPEFGRPRLPRKRGRMLRRLVDPGPGPNP